MLAICLWLKSALVVLILALARWLVSVWGEVRAIFSARDQIYVIFRDAKWIIALSFRAHFCTSSSGPDRRALSSRLHERHHCTAHLLISHSIRSAAHPDRIDCLCRLVRRQSNRVSDNGIDCEIASVALCYVHGFCQCSLATCLCWAAPLVSTTQCLCRHRPIWKLPGSASPWHRFNQRGQFDFITLALHLSVGIQVLGLLPAALLAPKFHAYLQSTAHRLNETHFGHWPGVAFALAMTSVITALFVAEPVMVPQMIGAFVILLLFTILRRRICRQFQHD